MSHELESRSYIWDALSQAKRALYSSKQGTYESNAVHTKNVKNLISVIEHYEPTAFEDQVLTDESLQSVRKTITKLILIGY